MYINLRFFYKRLLLFTGLLVSTGWAFWVSRPPEPESVNAASDQFSAQRAFTHIKNIAKEPHPVGTEAHRRVRAYLMDELRQMGLKPYLKSGTAIRAAGLSSACIHNIMAMIKGSNSGRTIVLMAHYDSVFYGPAAADDAGGVAAILEVARAILQGEQPKNNILIVFTDAEELGLLGANHFRKTYPKIKDVDIVLNLEARGTSGRSFMFETNMGNNNLIPQFDKANRWTSANSFTFSIYNLLPNSSDFTVIKPQGIQGLNFAFIDDLYNYHTMQDNPENISLKSLQHQGNQILNSTRHLANYEGAIKGNSDLIYFNNPFGTLTYYPQFLSLYLAGLPFLLLIYLFIMYNRETLWSTAKSAGLVIIMVIGLLFIHYFVARWVYYFNPQSEWLQQGELYRADIYFWAFLCLNTLIAAGGLWLLTNKFGLKAVMGGIYTVLAILSTVVAWYLPGMHYLLIWPLLSGVAGFILIVKQRQDEVTYSQIILLLTSFFPALFLLTPYVKFLHTALTTEAIAGGMFFALLATLICWPGLRILIYKIEARVLMGLLLIIPVLFSAAHVKSQFSISKKMQVSLMHHYDYDQKRAYWLSKDTKLNEWTRQFLGSTPGDTTLKDYVFFGNNSLMVKPYRMDNTAFRPPQLSILSDTIISGDRHFDIAVKFPEKSNIGRFSLRNSWRLQKIAVNKEVVFNRNNPIPNQTTGFDRLLVFTEQQEGYRLTFSVRKPEIPVQFQTTFYRTSFRKNLLNTSPDMPEIMMPKPFGFTYGMSWRKKFLLGSSKIEGRRESE